VVHAGRAPSVARADVMDGMRASHDADVDNGTLNALTALRHSAKAATSLICEMRCAGEMRRARIGLHRFVSIRRA
jgi:hypothetical protein